jgi:autotransporter-associated beta strand protein/T5SS/PEP-CTERM-associated repeat protein
MKKNSPKISSISHEVKTLLDSNKENISAKFQPPITSQANSQQYIPMRFSRICLIAIISLSSLCINASAGLVTQDLTQSVTGAGVDYTFNQFDTSLGTLNSVTFTIVSSIDSGLFNALNSNFNSVTVKNPKDFLTILDYQGTGADYNGALISLVTTPATGTVGYTLSGFSNQNFTVTPKSLIASPVITDLSAYLQDYTGSSVVTFGASIAPSVTFSGGGVSFDMSTILNDTHLSLVYDYTALASGSLYWLGSNGTLWTAANNWSSNATGTPTGNFTTGSDIVFSATGSSNETATNLGGDQTIASLTINATGPVGISGGNLTVNGDISVGSSSSNNSLQISNGVAASATSMWAGSEVGANNNQVTVGANATLTLTDDIYVGGNGSSNSLTITNGGAVSAYYMSAGREAGSNDNQVTVGANATLAVTDLIDVGFHGSSNNLTITNGGAVSANYTSAGREAGSNNNAILVTSNASMLINNDLIVGEAGSTNSMTVSERGRVTSSVGYIGKDATSADNTVTVTGTNSTWTNNGTLHVGYQGSNNTLTVANSGTVTASSISIASQAGSGGPLNIGTFGGSDTGGTINAPSIAFGNGTGTINFNQSNAMVLSGNISGSGSVNKLGTGTTTLSGANTYTGSTTISAGTLAVTGSLNGTSSLDVNGGSLAVTGGVTTSGPVNANSGTINIGQGGALVVESTTTTTNIDALFASNLDNSISVFDRSNNAFVAAIGSGHLNSPYGLAISSNGTLYAANYYGSSISIFGANGTYTGNITGNLNSSYGMAISSNGSLYAANYYGNSISIFGANGTYTGNITANLNAPYGLAISSNGTLYVSNYNSNSISIFGANGTYTGNITSQLRGPVGLAISSNGTLYAANSNDSISIFGANGTYTGNITSQLSRPVGLAISSNGTLYAANYNSNSISIFGANGTYTGNITSHLYVPAFVAIGNYTQESTTFNGLTLAASANDTATLNLGTFGGSDTTATLTASFVQFGNGTAAMNLNLAGTTTLSSDLLGGNSNSTINQLGTGTTTLTSANSTYAGRVNVNAGTLVLESNLGNATGTTISTGTLQLGNGGTTGSIAGNILNNGTLAINRSNDLVFSNTVNGTGSVTKDGNGTLTLTADNTYTGSTTISAGTLSIGNGGTSGSVSGNITNNAALAFNRSDDITFTDTISGTGTLEKLGTGTLTLSGGNHTTGGTTISAGTLTVTGSLTANGSVNANSGTLNIGEGGSLNVTGSTTTTTTIDALFASNRGSSTISVFDRSNNAFVAAIGSGHLNTPLGLAISSNGSIYAANNGGNSISIFGANGAYTGNIMGNLNYPYGLAISSNGTLYAANYYGNSISIFGANGTYTGNITANLNRPEGLAISSNGTLYAANFDGNSISIFGANGTYTGNITGNLNGPYGLAISSNGTLYAGNFYGNSISIFGANGTYTGNITGNLNYPYGLAISSNGTLYAANNLGNSISIFGANGTYTGNITGNLSYPAFVAIGNYTQEILVPNGLTLATSASDTATLNLGTFGGNDTTATLDAPFIRFGNGTAAMNLNLAGNTTVSADLLGGNSNSTINQLGTGTTTLTSANSTYAGGVNVSNGTLVLASNLGNATGTTISTGTLQLGDGGTIGIIGGNISNSGTLAINRSDDLVFSNTVTGAGSILKLGNNTVTYNSSNVTPQGGTTISSGKLLVTGTTSAVTINNSGILAGSGTVGAVTVNSGGAIAPGNSPGTITTGNMTWNGGGNYNWELASVNGTAGTDWDLISSAGSLTINATSGDKFTISLASFGKISLDGVKKASWEIGNFTTGITGFDKNKFSFNSIGMSGSVGGYSLSLGGGNTTLLLNYKTGVVWNTGTGDWTTASQWEDDSLPENGDAVEFSGTGGTSTNNYASGNLSEISGLTFTSSANGSYTINGNALTLGAGGLVNDSTSTQTVAIGLTLGADQTFAANSANLVVSGNISGAASLTKVGSETLTLSGSNTYTGETLVEAGTLAIASGGSLTGTSKIFVGNSTSGNTLDILGTASTGNMTLSHQVGSNDNTVTVGGGTSPASLTVANLINVGFGGTGNTLDILGNGTVTAASTWIGGYGANNSVNLTGGVLNSTTDVIVGYFAGENALNIIAGGNTTAGSIITGLDAASTNNTILVSGSNSALNTAGLIYLGQNGTSNSLVVENGGKVVSQNKDAVIGLNAGSNGNALSINGTGSRFTNNGTLYVGSTGSNNTLSVANGGNLATKSSRIGGDAASSNNIATVSGAGSVWNNTGTLRVGSFGSNNILAVTSGANVTVAGNTFIGYNATSANNLVSVEGAGSVLNLANATIGLSGANNTLRVADLGTINAVGIQLSGSDSTLQIGNGAAAGTINTSLGIGTGTGSGHQVVFNHTDSSLSFSPILTGNLSLKQIGTGKTILAANNTYIGTTTVNNGTLEVASGGSINGTSDVSVGILNGDNGTLHLNGGSVSNARGYLGAQVGSVGAATVSAGNWTNSGSLFVGVGGTGSLTINGTGHVTNEDGYIGNISGSNGTVSVSGGTWTNNINLFIGNEGTGSLTINGTANVKSMFGSVGNLPGGNGTVSVSGGTWTNSLDLSIGNGGTGSLGINGTGNVTSMFGYIGSLPDGNGTVSVSGGTWTNSSNLTIGIGGTGSLTINGTGTVIVGDTLSRGSNGRINLESGGTLQIGNGGTTGTLATDLTNNGTLIFDVTDSSTSGYAISGTGVVDKTGAGTLVLSGSSSNYSGATSIKAGTLLLESGYSNTASAVSVLSNGTLGGSGTAGDVTVLANATISPGGNAPVGISTFSISSVNPEIATLTVGNLTLNGGAIYNWQLGNASGMAGTDWDLISSLGTLSLNATSSNLTLSLSTFGDATLEGVKKASWEIANSTHSITGFNKNAFAIDSTSMAGNDGRYFMSLGGGNKTLILNYKSAATWNTGSGNWTAASQWEDEALPENGDEVEFAGSGGVSTNNFASGNLSTISGFSFLEGAGAYTVNGNTLQVGGDGIVNASSNLQTIGMNLTAGEVLTVDTAAAGIEISGVVSGNSSLTKTGFDTLTFSANNTYTGGTTIRAGTLALGGTAGAITGNITVDSGATFAVNHINNTTISNLISGNGSFAQVGSGVTSMVTNNTYSGGTYITSGTLWAKSAQALGTGNTSIGQGFSVFSDTPPASTAALLVSSKQEMGTNLLIGGNLDWYEGKIAYYDTGSSPLSGDLTINVAGSFTASAGDKTFDFSGVEALNYGSYTLVNATTVSAADTSFQAAHGPYTTLYGNFTTTNQTVVYTVTGAVSGGSDIRNNGGPNTPVVANYIVDRPTITVNQNNTVEALTFNSGGSLNIQQDGVLTVTSGTLNVQNGSSVVAGGTLIMPSGFTKSGTGALVLNNNVIVLSGGNTYSGGTTVASGSLVINGRLSVAGNAPFGDGDVTVWVGATLMGRGTIAGNVIVSGKLAPGNSPGTLSIAGNLNLDSGSTTFIEIESPTNFDRLIVSGQAALGGTLNAVTYGGGTITPGDRYDVLQAGSIVGAFDSLIAPDGLRLRFLNSGTVGTLLFGPSSYVPMAINQNQRNVAKALDTFIVATDGDRLAVSLALDSLTTEQFPSPFDQIMPGFYESLANIAIEQAFVQTQMLNQRISSVRLGAAGFQAIGGITQPLVHDKNGKSAADAKDASPIVESAIATNWNAWALGTGMFSRSTNLGSLQNYNNDAGGFLVGADYRWSENFVTGLYGGYDYSYAEYNGGGSTKGNSFSFGTYASYAKDGYYADAVIGGGYTGFQTQRSIEFSTIDRTASADPNSGQFTAGLNLGKDFEVGKFTLGPIVGAQYTYAGIGSFTESGAESLNLSLGQQNANSLRSTLGGRIAYTWNLNQKIALIPEVRMFWQHEFLNTARNINASLDGGNGAAFDFETSDPYRDSVFAGAGVTAQLGKNLSGSVFYNINFGSQTYQSNMVSAGLNFSF